MKVSAVIRGVSVGILAAAIVGGGFWLAKSGGSRDADSQGAGNASTAQPLAKNEGEPDETADAAASAAPTASPAATDSAATASPSATDSAVTASPSATDSAAAASPSATGSAAPVSATQSPETVTFEVKKGEDSATVSQNLEEAGIIEDAEKFNAYLEQTGASGRLHAGTYTFSVGASYPELAKAMAGASK